MVILHTDDVVWVRLPTRIPLVLSVWPTEAWWDWGSWSGRVVVGVA